MRFAGGFEKIRVYDEVENLLYTLIFLLNVLHIHGECQIN